MRHPTAANPLRERDGATIRGQLPHRLGVFGIRWATHLPPAGPTRRPLVRRSLPRAGTQPAVEPVRAEGDAQPTPLSTQRVLAGAANWAEAVQLALWPGATFTCVCA